jgi:hypothetical protein
MYVQTTNRCNMFCSHCCYSCGPKGKDMSRDTFVQACKLAEELGQTISIGGGEPTLHPLFWDFVGIALRYSEDYVWLATNGKRTEDALKLADLARRGILSVALSRSEFHEDIDPKVVNAFSHHMNRYGSERDSRDCREIRRTETIYPMGRGIDVATELEGCCCPDLFVFPNGVIYGCGCGKTTYGDVFDFENEEYFDICNRFQEIGYDLCDSLDIEKLEKQKKEREERDDHLGKVQEQANRED